MSTLNPADGRSVTMAKTRVAPAVTTVATFEEYTGAQDHLSADPPHHVPTHGRATTVTQLLRPRPRLLSLVATAIVTTSLAGVGCSADPPQQEDRAAASSTSCPEGPSDQSYEAATRDDVEFNATFRHGFAQVANLRMHYVEGGSADQTLILLHGWPSTWYEWRKVMPALAQDFRVVAVDLPGLGDSEGSPPSYDKATLARYVTGLADELGLESFTLVAHDFGSAVAYQVAVQQPERVESMIAIDFPLAGEDFTAAGLGEQLWHFAFHYQADIPEAVVANDVEQYLSLFYPLSSPNPQPVGRVAISEAVRTYCRPDVLKGGFDLYRTVAQDEADNVAVTAALPMPVRYLGSSSSPFQASWTVVDPDVEVVLADESVGHWIPEEAPEFVIEQIRDFGLR